MGNGCVKPPSHCGGGGNPSVKVILSDGTVEDFDKPITVAELMMDYPQHFVWQSSTQSASLQKKSILPAVVELEPGRVYYLLPSTKFSGPLSPPKTLATHVEEEEVHKFDLTNWKERPVPGLITRDDIGIGADSEDKDDDSVVSFSTPDLRSMYCSGPQAGLLRCNSWKPRLETIHEVGALSRKKFQNFVRGRGSMSQVHNYLSS